MFVPLVALVVVPGRAVPAILAAIVVTLQSAACILAVGWIAVMRQPAVLPAVLVPVPQASVSPIVIARMGSNATLRLITETIVIPVKRLVRLVNVIRMKIARQD